MSDSDQNIVQWSDGDFLDNAIVEAFVPAEPEFDFQDLLEHWHGDESKGSSSIVPFIEQRQFTFLDELLPVFVTLRTAPLSEHALRNFIDRLSVTIEARAVGSVPVQSSDGKGTQLTQANELLHSAAVLNGEEPIICAAELGCDDEGSEPERCLFSLWKALIPIGRPKAKIQKMGIYFATTASLKPPDKAHSPNNSDEFLPSMQPSPINLLEPFANDSALNGVKLYLSASRISRTPFSTPASKSNPKPLKTGPRRFFRAAPALLWRIRFVPLHDAAHQGAVVASLDFEVTNFAASSLSLDTIDLNLSSGTVEPLGTRFPLHCQPNDQVTLLFRLSPDSEKNGDIVTSSSNRGLSISAAATVYLSERSKPQISISWKTTVDFSSFRSKTRPTSLPHTASRPNSNRFSGRDLPKLPGPDSLPNTDNQHDARAITTSAAGVHLTVTAPKSVYAGEAFQWQLLVVNQSEHVQRLAVVVMPKRRRVELLRPGSGSKDGPKRIHDKDSIPKPVADDHLLAQLQRSSIQDTTELICLSPDIRIGPLAAAACFETEIEFLPLATGVLHVESLRLVDLNTQEAIDVRDLPDIVAVERESE